MLSVGSWLSACPHVKRSGKSCFERRSLRSWPCFMVLQAYGAVGSKLAEENLSHISEMMNTFKGSLEEFARKYKKDINQDPAFRQQFQVMCASIG